jgi:hypothetical protein
VSSGPRSFAARDGSGDLPERERNPRFARDPFRLYERTLPNSTVASRHDCLSLSAPRRLCDIRRPTGELLGGMFTGRPPYGPGDLPAVTVNATGIESVVPRGPSQPVRCDLAVGRRVTDCPQALALDRMSDGVTSALVAAGWGTSAEAPHSSVRTIGRRLKSTSGLRR